MIKKIVIILCLILYPMLAYSAGLTDTDFIDYDVAAGVPGAPSESMCYYDGGDDVYYCRDDTATWVPHGLEVYGWDPEATCPIAAAEGYVYADSDDHRLYYYNGTDWEPLNEQTLGEAYTESPTITIDAAGSLTLSSTLVDATDMLTISRSGAAGTGQLLDLSDTQTGNHISMILDVTSGNASSRGMLLRDNAADTADLAYLYGAQSVDAVQVVQDGYLAFAATTDKMIDAFDGSDAEIINCLNCGVNTILGTSTVIDFDNFDLDAAGDLTLSETGGNAADPDCDVNGFAQLGAVGGGLLGNDINATAFSADGVITFMADARPTHSEWHSVQDLDLVVAGGDGSDPAENEAGSTAKYSSWTWTEGSTIAYYTWLIPAQVDVSAAINIYIVWLTEGAGGDSCLWRVRHDGGKTFNNDEVPSAPSTVLSTPIADDTTDTQYEIAKTDAGIINGATFTDGEIVTFDFYLTDCDAGEATDYADMLGFVIEYRLDTL